MITKRLHEKAQEVCSLRNARYFTFFNVSSYLIDYLQLAPVLSMIRGKSRFTKYIVAAFASYIILTLLFGGTGEKYWKQDWVKIARSTLEDRALEHIQNETLGVCSALYFMVMPVAYLLMIFDSLNTFTPLD